MLRMNNYDKALDLTEAAYDSNGSAMEKYNVYQQSIAAQQERITALWQTFVEKMNVGDVYSDWLSLVEVFGKIFSDDLITNILKFAPAVTAAAMAIKVLGSGFGLSLKTLGKDIAALISISMQATTTSTGLLAAFSKNAISGGTWITLAITAAITLYQVLSRVIKTTDDLRSEMSGLANEIEQAQSDIDSYNSQITENSTRISELNQLKRSGVNLSIVEQSELENLQLENKELETNIALLEEQIALKNEEKRKAAEELYSRNSEAIFNTNQGGWEATIVGYKNFEDVFRENVDRYNDIQEQIKNTDVEDTETLSILYEQLEAVREKLTQNAEDAQEIIEAYGKDDPVAEALQNSLDYYVDSLQNLSEEVTNVVNSNEFEDASEQLMQLAANGELSADTLNNIAFEGLVGALQDLGLDIEDIITLFQRLADEAGVTADSVNRISEVTMVDNLENQIGGVADAINELNEAGYLSQETVKGLVDAGYDLGDSLQLTENGYLINRDALLALLEAKRAEYEATMNESLQAAANLVGAKIDEKAAYDSVTNSILAKLDAQMAEAQVSANLKINQATDALYAGDDDAYFQLNREAHTAAKNYNELKKAKTNLENSLANLDTYDTAIDYILNSRKSSSGSGGSSSSSSDVETAFERDIRILEHQQYLAEQWAGVYEDEAGKEAEYQAKVNEQIEIYGKLMERVHEEAEKYRQQGYDDESEVIQDLQKQYWEYYNARKDLIDDLADYQKEKEEEEREAVEDALDELKDAIDDLLDEAERRLDKLVDHYDYQIKKLEAMRDLTKSYYDTVNEVNDLQHEIDKELAKSKGQYAYLDESLRDTLFNEDDYNRLSDKLEGIADECNDLYQGYLQDLSELTEEDIWKADLITAEYERQYNYKLMEYQVANAELNLIKAQTNLQNVLANRNVRMYQNGQWTWVADHEAVADAEEQMEEARYEYKQAQIELRQQAVIDEYDGMIAGIQAQKDAAEAEFEALREQWEEVQEQLTTEEDAMTRILNLINETDIPMFQEIIGQCGDSLVDLVNRISSMAGGSGGLSLDGLLGGGGGIGGGGGGVSWGSTYDSSTDYLAAAIQAAKNGNLDEAQELWNRRGYKVEAEGDDRGTSQSEAWDKIMNAYNNRGSSGGGGSSSSSSRPSSGNHGGYGSREEFDSAIKDAANQAASTGQNVSIGNSGLYIDASKLNKSKYDSGGILEGMGGIKATDRDEVIFDEILSSKLLSPQKSKAFLDSADALTKLLDNSTGFSRLMSALANVVDGEKGSVDSHDFVWNGSLMGKIKESDYDSISSIMRRYIPIMKG